MTRPGVGRALDGVGGQPLPGIQGGKVALLLQTPCGASLPSAAGLAAHCRTAMRFIAAARSLCRLLFGCLGGRALVGHGVIVQPAVEEIERSSGSLRELSLYRVRFGFRGVELEPGTEYGHDRNRRDEGFDLVGF